ncbi:MAG: ion channel [Pseudomonadota bacterium]
MIALAILAVAVVICVSLHRWVVGFVYNGLRLQASAGMRPHHHVSSVLLLLGAHIVEVIVFALGAVLVMATGEATVSGRPDAPFVDVLYFSFNVYSSLGFGDVVPTGDLRLYAGVEVIVGLLMIAWSAAALFGEAFLARGND